MATDGELAFVESGIGSDLDTMVVYNILRTNSRLAPLVDEDLRRRDLRGTQLNVLLVLREAGDAGLRMSEIGRKLVVTRSNVTGLVDRLERGGLVRRTPHSDRRATVVRLTDEGRRLVERIGPAHGKALAGLTGGLAPADKKTLIRLLTKLRRALRRGRREGR